MNSSRQALIVNADDLGFSRSSNKGIQEAARRGFLTSASVLINGPAFKEAVCEVAPECSGLGLGVHLNISEGYSIRRKVKASSALCDADGRFRLSFTSLLRMQKNALLISEIEAEFREQIETALLYLPSLDHVNSHHHAHAVPALFELVCRLAHEYNIPYIRLPRERPYSAGSISVNLRAWYSANVLKLAVLNTLARVNVGTARQYAVRTNDWLVGISYTGFMTAATVRRGLDVLLSPGTCEVLLHPASVIADRSEAYPSAAGRGYVLDPSRKYELETLLNRSLHNHLVEQGWKLTCYGCLTSRLDSDHRVLATPVGEVLGEDRKTVSHAAPHDHEMKSSPPARRSSAALRTFVIIEEAPLYHPEYLRRLINDCADIEVCGGALVSLSWGGKLQQYLVRHISELGYLQFVLLALKILALRVAGYLPRAVRGNFDASVEMVLRRFEIPYRKIQNVKDARFLAYVKAFEPDLILSSNPLIIPDELISLPKVACINRHSALLPAYGGVLPVFRALQKGESFTGASVHHVTPVIDRGPVLSRKWIPIFPGDTVDGLYKLAFRASYEATAEAVSKLRSSTPEPLEDDGLQASYFSYPTREDWKEFRARGAKFI